MIDVTRTDDHTRTDSALDLLAAGVPLSLLLDLAAAVPSREIYAAEPGDTRWVPSLSA
jgi:hypothetical protein